MTTKAARMGLICVIMAYTGRLGAEGTPTPLQACDKALMACQGVITAQQNEIKALKVDIKQLEEKSSQPTLLQSPLTWGIIGLLAGGLTVSLVKH